MDRAAPAPFDPIRDQALLAPDRIALVDLARERRWTYAELDADAERWRVRLLAAGVVRGDRIAVLAGNRAELAALLFACGRIGAALVPLNWRLAVPELLAVLSDARPVLVVSEVRFATIQAAGPHFTWLSLDDVDVIDASDAPPPVPDGDLDASHEDAALVLYTSGSTGRPKGAILSHRQLRANAIATVDAWKLSADDIGPVTTPFFHTGGWNVFALPLWSCGGCVVLFEQFTPDVFLKTLATERCTVAFGVPTQLVMLMEAPGWGRALPTLRWFISGGAPCPPGVAARVRAAGYRLREGFGMTEFGPNCFGITDEAALAKPGSVGWPAPFVEIRLVDDAGVDVPAGTVGELWLRGPQLFSGYLGDPARTAEVLSPDGWLRTGDLAERDADGAFFIRGRRKELFISGGENVYPGEVEAALVDCAGVSEAAVIGVPHPRWGEVGHAFVVSRAGAVVEPEALLHELRGRIAGYKVPKGVTVLDSLPRTATAKIDRRSLAAQLPEVVR